MCGIVGYIAKQHKDRDVTDFILERVKASQHRGYQGVGVATMHDGVIEICKSTGGVDDLRQVLNGFTVRGIGMAHNRWQTHGVESIENSHPHASNDGTIVVVHNGEIYNKEKIKKFLIEQGFHFLSDTDTECIPNLIQYYFSQEGDIKKAIALAMNQLDGCNAVVVMTLHLPNTLVVYNNSQTLTLVDNDNFFLVVSDAEAIPVGKHQIVEVLDDDFLFVTSDGFEIINQDRLVNRATESITVDLTEVDTGGYATFTEKEIFQQGETTHRTLAGRIDTSTSTVVLGMEKRLAHRPEWYERIVLLGIGTSYHACLTAKYYFEQIARLPTEVIMAAEFFGTAFLPEKFERALVISVSQSGKTSELVDVIKFLQRKGIEVASVSNVVKATIPKMTLAGVFLKAGPERGVASTKAFTSQLIALYLLAIFFAQSKHLGRYEAKHLLDSLSRVPVLVQETLDLCAEPCKIMAPRFAAAKSVFYLAKGINWPVMLEGALKMQEIAYINARGYSASEMFHGPRAMLDQQVLSVGCINETDPHKEQMIASMEKCHSAQSPVCLIVERSLASHISFDFVYNQILIPDVSVYELTPFVNVIPLQLLAFYTALYLGHHPDYPRNLAKVITTR